MAIAIEARLDPTALSSAVASLVESLRPTVVRVGNGGRGSGAGVVWHPDGLIVTNAHVVPVDRPHVRLFDGRELPARVLARDPARDLAALRVDATGLAPAPVGDSAALRVGQLVIAMGHPFGEPHAVSIGIVSRVDAAHPADDRSGADTVQADLSLFPGNSGGPLVDAAGRVVGINSMVVPPRLALAVASRAVQRFLAAPPRPRLGIRFRPVGLPPPLVQRLALPSDAGLIVVEVQPESVAARAGILLGDVLLAVDDRAVHQPRVLVDRLACWESERLSLRLLRGGAVRTIEVNPASAR